MKKHLLIALAVLLQAGFLKSQTILNPGFEAWTIVPYEEPNSWISTSNFDCINRGAPANVTKVSGTSGFGIRLQTNVVGPDTLFAYISNTSGDPVNGKGGVPYSQQPTGITGFYRYNLPVNDTALLLVIFKKNGAIISNNLYKIRGTGTQSTFAAFTYTFPLTQVPDSMVIAAASSNAIANVGVQNGSYLELDQLSFTGTSITQQISNGDFSGWTSVNFDRPWSWSRSGNITRSSAAPYTGTYNISLTTTDYGGGFVFPSGITTGSYTQSGTKGGQPYTLVTDSLIGFYKYTATGLDSASVFISLSKNGTIVGGKNYNLPPAAAWTKFKVGFTSGTAPDSMRVDFSSSIFSPNIQANSNLQLDQLYLKSQPVGLFEMAKSDISSKAFPNPASKALSIYLNEKAGSAFMLGVFDNAGRKVISKEIPLGADRVDLDIQELPAGVYHYVIKTENGNISNKFIKQ